MFARSTAVLAIRTFVFTGLFVAPVGIFAANLPQHSAGLGGAGFVLLVSLQRGE
jgi:hypothetical protein